MSAVRVEGLRVSYGALEAVRGVDLVIEPGEASVSDAGVLAAWAAGATVVAVRRFRWEPRR